MLNKWWLYGGFAWMLILSASIQETSMFSGALVLLFMAYSVK